MQLMSAEDAIERWPFEFYDDDTAGGMQRRIILEFWEMAENLPPDAAEALGGLLAIEQSRLDAMIQEGTRAAFRHVMGYDLP